MITTLLSLIAAQAMDDLFALHPDDASEIFFDAKTCERNATVQHAFLNFE